MVEIGHHGVEVHLENGLVNLLLKQFGYVVEAKLSGSFYEYHLVVKRFKCFRLHKLAYVFKEIFFCDIYDGRVFSELRSYTDEFLHPTFLSHAAYDAIELVWQLSALLYITEYQCALASVVVWSATHEVECYVE